MGGDPRRPHVQHQNRFAFKHNKASRKTAKILALPNEGLCTKCHDIIEWRKQFRKYKPLSTPRRCQICDQKKVTRAYHNICDHCATDSNTCAKCRESKVIVNPIITPEQEKADMDLVRGTMATMSERERRTFVRTLNANKPDKDPNVTGDEEDYWAPEEEIDWVKAARLLRSLEAMKREKAEASNKLDGEDDGEQEGEQECEGEKKKGEKDVKMTNSDPSIEKDDNDDEEGDDEGEDDEDDQE